MAEESAHSNQTEAFPAPGEVSRRLTHTVQCFNALALALNAGVLGILARRQSLTGAKGLLLLAGAEMGINLSLLVMHTETWSSSPLPVVDKFNYSFEAFHLLRNAWLCAMTIARALAVSRPFTSTRLLTRRQQVIIFGAEAAASAAWSVADLLLVGSGPKVLRRGLALLRHFLNTVAVGSVIVATSAVIVHHVRRSAGIQSSHNRRRDHQASKIVVTLAIGFFLLEVPNALLVFAVIVWLMTTDAVGFKGSIVEPLHIMVRVNHLLIVLNTCLNPFVLLAFSSSFRRQVLEALMSYRRRRGGQNQSTQMNLAAMPASRYHRCGEPVAGGSDCSHHEKNGAASAAAARTPPAGDGESDEQPRALLLAPLVDDEET